MVRRSEMLEGLIGRRAVSCLGIFLILFILLIVLALLWPSIFPRANAPTKPPQAAPSN
jgi:hypothetical protein